MKSLFFVIFGFITGIVLSRAFSLPIETELAILVAIAIFVYAIDRYILRKNKKHE